MSQTTIDRTRYPLARKGGRPPGLPKTGGRPKGIAKSGGRAKGTPNKLNRDIKEMVLTALNNAGGAEYLTQRAFDCPTAFLALVGRVLPMQVTGANGNPIAVDFRWADASEIVDTAENAHEVGRIGGLDTRHAHTDALTIDGDRATDALEVSETTP